MSDQVEFDTDVETRNLGRYSSHNNAGYGPNTGYGGGYEAPRLPGMAGWLVARGIIRSESGAHAFMLGIIAFNFIVAGLIIYFFVLK